MDGVNLDSLRGLRREVVLKDGDRKRERERWSALKGRRVGQREFHIEK